MENQIATPDNVKPLKGIPVLLALSKEIVLPYSASLFGLLLAFLGTKMSLADGPLIGGPLITAFLISLSIKAYTLTKTDIEITENSLGNIVVGFFAIAGLSFLLVGAIGASFILANEGGGLFNWLVKVNVTFSVFVTVYAVYVFGKGLLLFLKSPRKFGVKKINKIRDTWISINRRFK